jgi:hypothetical protein
MTSFDPTPTTLQISPAERLRRSYSRGIPFEQAFEANLRAGFMSSFGLGTAVRELTAPPLLTDSPQRGDTPENYARRIQTFREKALDEEAYKASPYYRSAIKWQRGMTEDRAATLARWYDEQQVAADQASRNPVAGFAGQFAGQMFDPVNYIPVFGPSAHAAAIAKAGSIFGRAGIAASEAAINTAAFGVVTSGIRSNYGDTVSFEAILNEIAMSALIGGAFGAGVGVLARAGDNRVKDAVSSARAGMDDLRAKVKARDLAAKAAKDLADKGYVDMSREHMRPIEDTARELDRRTIGVRELERQSRDVVGDKPGEVVFTPDGVKVAVRPRVVEASELGHASGSLQVRDRTRFDSERWVEETATNLNPALLRPDISSDRGAPIIGDDMVIDSGNGRVMAIKRAYEAYPDKAAAYRADIEAQGFSTEGFNNPVLVMERTTVLSPEARAAFNAQSNARTSASMSASEVADMDAAAMDDEVLAIHADGPVSSADNSAFVSAFISRLPKAERGALVDKLGRLNKDGERRIENALVSLAYGGADPTVIRRFTEATDDNSRSILGAMSDVAGTWAKLQRAIGRGDIDPAFDPAPALTSAVRYLNAFRQQAAREKRPVSVVIKEGLAQLDLLQTENLPARRMIEAFYNSDDFTKALGRDVIATYLNRIAANVEALGQPQLFGRPGVSLHEVIEHATADEQANAFVNAGDLGFPPAGGEGDGIAALDAGGEAGGRGPSGEGAEGIAAPAEVNGQGDTRGSSRGAGRGARVSAEPPADAPRSWRELREADGSLRGLPRKIGRYTASVYEKAQEVAAGYMKRAGLDYRPPFTYAKVDPVRAGRIADAYEAMKHDPHNPEVQAAYKAMIDETLAQY